MIHRDCSESIEIRARVFDALQFHPKSRYQANAATQSDTKRARKRTRWRAPDRPVKLALRYASGRSGALGGDQD